MIYLAIKLTSSLYTIFVPGGRKGGRGGGGSLKQLITNMQIIQHRLILKKRAHSKLIVFQNVSSTNLFGNSS